MFINLFDEQIGVSFMPGLEGLDGQLTAVANAMVERFNGRLSELISEWVGQTRFASAAELQSTLTQYLATYNHSIPLSAL